MAKPDDPLHDLNGAELEPAVADAGPPSTPTDELGRDVPDGWPVGVYVGDGVDTSNEAQNVIETKQGDDVSTSSTLRSPLVMS